MPQRVLKYTLARPKALEDAVTGSVTVKLGAGDAAEAATTTTSNDEIRLIISSLQRRPPWREAARRDFFAPDAASLRM